MTKATHKLVTYEGDEFEVYYHVPSHGFKTTDGCAAFGSISIQSLTPLPSEPEEAETFDYKEAMRMILDGVEIQYLGGETSLGYEWIDYICAPETGHHFYKRFKYRRKPIAPPAPKVTVRFANLNRYIDGELWIGPIFENEISAIQTRIAFTLGRLKITVTEGELPKVEVLPVN